VRGVNYHAALKDLLVDAGRLRPHPENPRNGHVEAILTSIKKNGVYRPVYAQASTGYVIGGNHLYAALMESGATQIPALWLDVGDSTARRILVADNRIAALGNYDDPLLAELLEKINEDTGLLGTGYEPEDLAELLDRIEADGERTLHVEFDAHPPAGGGRAMTQCPSCGYEWEA
jgi:ParB-like chromosome segregation protein Spo0J